MGLGEAGKRIQAHETVEQVSWQGKQEALLVDDKPWALETTGVHHLACALDLLLVGVQAGAYVKV